MEYALLIGSFALVGLGIIMTIDHNPYLCKTLKIKFICGKNSFLRKLFPYKENRTHPYSYFRILPLFISIIIFSITILIYIIYWFNALEENNSFVESNLSFYIGTGMLMTLFLYPVFLIIFNKIYEIKESLMSEEKYEELDIEYERYYQPLDK